MGGQSGDQVTGLMKEEPEFRVYYVCDISFQVTAGLNALTSDEIVAFHFQLKLVHS